MPLIWAGPYTATTPSGVTPLWAGPYTVTTTSAAAVTPTDLVAYPVSSSQIALQWTDNSGGTNSVRIERSPGGAGTYTQIGTVPAGTTVYAATGLTPTTSYNFRIRADNGAGSLSAYSNVASATTYAAPVVGGPPALGPVPIVELALFTKPTEAPIWLDVSDYCESLSFRRGRQSPLESTGAGTGTLRLSNTDRRFDPRHTTGPYYGNLKPMRRGRVRVTHAGVTHDLINFYVNGWPQTREHHGRQYVEVGFADAFKVLALAKLNASLPLQSSDARIAAVLSLIAWTTGQAGVLGDATYGVLGSTLILGPVGDRALDAGQSSVQAVDVSNTTALSHVQDVERSEGGLLFHGKGGAITFHSRNHRLSASSASASLATFGDNLSAGSGELPYVAIGALEYDDQQIYNDVRVTTTDGVEQVATDGAGQLEYFPRTYSQSVLVPTDAEALSIATYILGRYKEPQYRITSLVLDPEDGTDRVYTQLFARELGDVVTVRTTPLGGGARIEQVSHIEGIALNWQAEGNVWGGTWQTSAADVAVYWELGVSTLGPAGSNPARLAY